MVHISSVPLGSSRLLQASGFSISLATPHQHSHLLWLMKQQQTPTHTATLPYTSTLEKKKWRDWHTCPCVEENWHHCQQVETFQTTPYKWELQFPPLLLLLPLPPDDLLWQRIPFAVRTAERVKADLIISYISYQLLFTALHSEPRAPKRKKLKFQTFWENLPPLFTLSSQVSLSTFASITADKQVLNSGSCVVTSWSATQNRKIGSRIPRLVKLISNVFFLGVSSS